MDLNLLLLQSTEHFVLLMTTGAHLHDGIQGEHARAPGMKEVNNMSNPSDKIYIRNGCVCLGIPLSTVNPLGPIFSIL